MILQCAFALGILSSSFVMLRRNYSERVMPREKYAHPRAPRPIMKVFHNLLDGKVYKINGSGISANLGI